MSKHHGLYKFVTCDTNEIIYIGKTNNNLKCRVAAHIRGKGIDEKFNVYKGNYKVFVAFLPNNVETDIMERALINQYKPVLNGTDNYEGISNLIKVEEPQWIEFEKAFPEPDLPKKPKIDKYSDDILIGTLSGTDYYLTNTYSIKKHGKRIEMKLFDTVDEALEYIKYVLYLCEKYGTYNAEYREYDVPVRYGQKYYNFWNDNKHGLWPSLVIIKKKEISCYAIISSMSGKGDVLEKISFYQSGIDICKLIIEELTNAEIKA